MTRDECVELIAAVCVYFPERKLADGVVAAWMLVLGDLDYDDATQALGSIMRTSDSDRRWVQPGEIRRRVFEQLGLLAKSLPDALSEAREYCDRWLEALYSVEQGIEANRRLGLADPLVLEAITAIGGPSTTAQLDPAQFNAQFRDAYREVAARHDRRVLDSHVPTTRALRASD